MPLLPALFCLLPWGHAVRRSFFRTPGTSTEVLKGYEGWVSALNDFTDEALLAAAADADAATAFAGATAM